MGKHQLGDDAVLAHRLLDQLLLLIELGQLDVIGRIVGLELRHLLVDGDGRGGVLVLLVVVRQHLVLGAGLGDQPLAVIELGEVLVDVEPRRV